MLKKTITYEDFNGEEQTEDFFFHLSKADLVALEVSHKGGLGKWIENITASEDGAAILREFKKLLLSSYGKKSDDGKRFIKSDELRQDFESSPAYDVIFMELVTDAEKAASFVNGIVPQGLNLEVAKMSTGASDEAARVRELGTEETVEEDPQNVFEGHKTRVLTTQEIVEMDADELKSGIAAGKYTLPQ